MTRYLISIVFCWFVLSGKAQVYLGLMGGGSFTEEVEVRGAIPVEWEKNSYFSLRAELAVTVRGNQEIVRKINISTDVSIENLLLLELPIMARFTLPTQGFQPYLTIGLQVGYGISVHSRYIDAQQYFKEKFSFREAGLKHLDSGLTFGIGLEKSISGNRRIFADLRHYLGILNIDDAPQGEIYNQGTALSIGLLLPIRRK